MEVLKELPSKEVVEWYISGGSGGKDHRGVAVRFNRDTGVLEPDSNFGYRVRAWLNAKRTTDIDPYSLSEMPDLSLLQNFVGHRGVIFNLLTHRLERTATRFL